MSTPEHSTFYSTLARNMRGAQLRDKATLVPPAFQILWQTIRFIVLYGGRDAAKSHSIARVLLVTGAERPLRILCCREIQGSIRESAYRLLCDLIAVLQLDEAYDIQSDSIIGRNGTRFFFEGLRYNASKIRSYEAVDVVWCEEAQNVSEMSWETLLPTIRKKGSRFFVSFNPMTKTDPVLLRFVESKRPDVLAKHVTWRDNPWHSAESEAERVWLERTDPDAHRHVWEGFPREVSDAIILKGKCSVEEFEPNPMWAGPYYGLDHGYARDPAAAVRAFIDPDTRQLFVADEFWQLGCDIDALPSALDASIPGITRHPVYADSARPESNSYLARNGIPGARSAEKWPGSVDDGIAYLRSFERIVIHPRCKHLIDEAASYSFKTDRLTGLPLPEPEDKNNHLIDALRYALSPLIRNLPTGGYISRSALLVNGEPMSPPSRDEGLPNRVFMTAALCDRPGTAVGILYWVHSPHHGMNLTLLDYELVEIDQLTEQWLRSVFSRAQALRAEWGAIEDTTGLWAEEGDLHNALTVLFESLLLTDPQLIAGGARPLYDLGRVESKRLPRPADRMPQIRTDINQGRLLKFAHAAYTRKIAHRGQETNPLTAQLFGWRPDTRDAAEELVNAFALGFLMCPPMTRPLVPIAAEEEEPAPAPPQKMWFTHTGLWLPGPPPEGYTGPTKYRHELGF